MTARTSPRPPRGTEWRCVMARGTNVVVVGGGVPGTSIGYYLARAGIGVTLLENGFLASARRLITSAPLPRLMIHPVAHESIRATVRGHEPVGGFGAGTHQDDPRFSGRASCSSCPPRAGLAHRPGSMNVKVEPRPGSLCTQVLPPWSRRTSGRMRGDHIIKRAEELDLAESSPDEPLHT